MRKLLEGTKYRKIGLLGSAPSSLTLAPYKDQEWTFWGCSPGVYGIAPRTEAWFEMHVWEPGQPWFSPEYCTFVRNYPGPVFVSAPNPEIKNAIVVPLDELMQHFGPYFWTSTVAYMFALAILERPDEIGLWGVDMSASEEWGYQRAGCQYMAQVAHIMGIKVTVPPQSDLLVAPPCYGFVEQSHQYLKMRARMIELTGRRTAVEQLVQQKTGELHFLSGAIDDMVYQLNTWPGMMQDIVNPAAALEKVVPALPDQVAKLAEWVKPNKGNGQDGEPIIGHPGRDHGQASGAPA